MVVAENEIFADPDYVLWDRKSDVRLGCRDVGFVAITPVAIQAKIRFVDCRFVADDSLTGSGTYAFATNTDSWSVTVPDGTLEYAVDHDGRRVSGTWKGQPVDLSE